MIILSAAEVERALPMPDAIQAMKRAFAALSDGHAIVPLRLRLPIPDQEAVSLIMPAYLSSPPEQALAIKVVSVFPHNPARRRPLIYAAVLVLDPHSGEPQAMLEGGTLTAIRTGAASGAATDLLARPDSRVLAVFGAGRQARTQLRAVCAVRPIQRVWIYDPNRQQVETMIAELAGQPGLPSDLRPAESSQQALAEADVVCTATTSAEPVFSDHELRDGVHINGVGSYTPEMAEIPAETVRRARVVIDHREAALQEAGDLIQPLRRGLIPPEHCQTELGDIILGRQTGREDPRQITFFKSVGVAIQDAAAAQLALANARAWKLGTFVPF